MTKQINLGEILKNELSENMQNILDCNFQLKIVTLDAMKEAVKQALELAAENAKIKEIGNTPFEEFIIDKQSILNTINQVI